MMRVVIEAGFRPEGWEPASLVPQTPDGAAVIVKNVLAPGETQGEDKRGGYVADPGESVAAGLAGCGCLALIVGFFAMLIGGAGFFGSLGVVAVLVVLLAVAVGSVS